MHLLNASATTAGIVVLSAKDRPTSTIGMSAIVKGSSTANLYVAVDNNGIVKLFNNGSVQVATNAVTATLDWYVI